MLGTKAAGFPSLGFPCGSSSKESACSAGDLGSIPRSGRSAGEGIGYSLQYSWASLVAQLVKNPPALQEAWVQSLSWEDPLENEKAAHSSTLAWRIPRTSPWGRKESDVTEQLSRSLSKQLVASKWNSLYSPTSTFLSLAFFLFFLSLILIAN